VSLKGSPSGDTVSFTQWNSKVMYPDTLTRYFGKLTKSIILYKEWLFIV